jgi:putative PIG3 family NAD(P)H quinone oxidoreductase
MISRMRVIEMQGSGGPEVLRLAERPSPVLEAGSVRVRVASSGLNRADLLQRRGQYPVPAGYPEEILGMEFAGTILELGDGCHHRRIGDRVMGILGGGGYSEEIVVPEQETIRIPSGISTLEAGAIPEVFITAWDALVRQARLSPGETVLLHSVGSGVGSAALQLCLAMGCSTIGTSRSEWKLERAVEMGLHHAILLREGGDRSWVAEVEAILHGVSSSDSSNGVQVLLDLVGGAYFEGNLQLLKRRGRWVVVGLPSGSEGNLNLRTFITKRATLIGTVLRGRSREEKVTLAGVFEREVVPLFERGELRPIVDRTFPAEDATAAHQYLEGNKNFGKVLLTWSAHG